MPSLLIKAGQILTMDRQSRVLDGGGVMVSGSTIARVLDRKELAGWNPMMRRRSRLAASR